VVTVIASEDLVVTGREASTSAWTKALAALSLVLGFLMWMQWATAVSLVEIWSRSETYAHGFVVPFISAWLFWRRRDEWLNETPRPGWAAIPLLAAGSLLWLAGQLAEANVLAQCAFVMSLILAVVALLGKRVAAINAFALGFLLFAVPVGEIFIPQLMDWTADFAVMGLRASGVPVYREGLQFGIPSGKWSVIEACSGVRYLLASLTVGTLFAYLTYRSWPRRLAFAVMAVLVPIIANWVRAYLIVMLGHLSGNRLAAGVDHLIYGWVFFGMVIFVMFWIGARWREADAPGTQQRSSVRTNGAGGGKQVWAVAVSAAIAAALGPAIEAALGASNTAPSSTPRLTLPVELGDWQEATESPLGWKPHFEYPTSEFQTRFRSRRGEVGLYLAFYRQQDSSRKLISSVNVLVTSQDESWHRLGREERTVTAAGRPIAMKGEVLRGPSQVQLTAWTCYRIDGRWTANSAWAKVLTAWSRLRGHGDDGAAVVIYALGETGSDAGALLSTFAAVALPAVGDMLDQVNGQR
jgi:exosortase A